MSADSAFRTSHSAILFDAVGTLIYADPSPAIVYERHGRRFGSRQTVDEIAARFRAAFAEQEAEDRRDPAGCTSEDRERRRWQTIVRETFVDLADTAELFHELWHHFAAPTAWQTFGDACDVISRLIADGAIVGVASNFDARLLAIIAYHFPAIAIERVFASSFIGHRKPSREFFAGCAKQLSQSMNTASMSFTFVGDDVENDFIGARNAGWRAVLLDSENRFTMHSPRIADLRLLRTE